MIIRVLAVALALAFGHAAQAQSAYPGDLGDFSLPTPQGQGAFDWGVPPPDSHKQDVRDLDSRTEASRQKDGEADALGDSEAEDASRQKEGEADAISDNPRGAIPDSQNARRGFSGGQPPPGFVRPSAPQDGFPPLDPSDRNYDPLELPDMNRRIPTSCAEEGSTCRQCVLDAETNIQFNRRYLHIAWSVTNSHLVYAERMIRFGDAGSGFHGAMALSWQLGGKPQIEEAVAQLRQTYKNKYRDYMQNIRRSLDKLAACEQDNFSTQDLYAQYANLYYDMLETRYENPD
jgi:hypothetical protein